MLSTLQTLLLVLFVSEVKSFKNIDMVWKPGHLPTAFLYDRKDGNLVHEVQLGDWDKETFIAELANYDFDPILDPYTLYNTAVHEITFQNTVYQLYSPIPHEQIAALADANTADIVEIYSDEVNDMLLDLVGPGVSVWLSGQRRNVLEGEHGANYAFRWAKQKSGRHEYGTWKEGEPDNAGSPLPGEQFAEACVVVRDKLFEDVACNTVHAVVLYKPYISKEGRRHPAESSEPPRDEIPFEHKLPPPPKSPRRPRKPVDKEL